MSVARSLFPVLLLLAACGQPGVAASGAAGEQAMTAVSCDAPAVQVAIGSTTNADIPATRQAYPANARYYCVNVPAGVSRVTMTLSGMTTDLDLYVGSGTIQSVQGVNVEQGETYEWKSNAFGTADERVVIANPEPGVYYAEIVSYQGEASPYQFTVQ